mgnify:CR=1 FL=1
MRWMRRRVIRRRRMAWRWISLKRRRGRMMRTVRMVMTRMMMISRSILKGRISVLRDSSCY